MKRIKDQKSRSNGQILNGILFTTFRFNNYTLIKYRTKILVHVLIYEDIISIPVRINIL